MNVLTTMDPLLIAAAVIPAVWLLVKVYRADRLEREPIGLILLLVVFGALSTALAMVTETIGEYALQTAFSENSLIYLILEYYLVVALS